MPKEALRLIRLAELRVLCAEKGLRRVEVHGDKVILRRDSSPAPFAVDHIRGTTPERKITALFKLVSEVG